MNEMNFGKKLLSKDESQRLFEQFSENGNNLYKGEDPILRKELFLPLSQELERSKLLGSKKEKYKSDIFVGMKLYELLSPLHLSMRIAASDDFWRYLSIKVLPDLVYARWDGLKKDRFWEKPNRIWLRVIWWYVHLAWQNDAGVTMDCLNDSCFSTDTVAQLVERSGRHGYRIDLYRCMMLKAKENQLNQEEFRAMMTLNTIRIVNIEPRFFNGGVSGYVDNLIGTIKNNVVE